MLRATQNQAKERPPLLQTVQHMQNHFKVKALGQIVFNLFRLYAECVTKLRKGNVAIVTNCSAYAKSFQSKSTHTRSHFFYLFRLYAACDTESSKGKATIVTNCSAYTKSFQSKSTQSDFFSILFFCLYAVHITKSSKGKAAIVTNCSAYMQNHFKVKALGQIFFNLFRLYPECVTKLSKGTTAIVTNCSAYTKSFQSKSTQSEFFYLFRLFSYARHEIKQRRGRHCYELFRICKIISK